MSICQELLHTTMWSPPSVLYLQNHWNVLYISMVTSATGWATFTLQLLKEGRRMLSETAQHCGRDGVRLQMNIFCLYFCKIYFSAPRDAQAWDSSETVNAGFLHALLSLSMISGNPHVCSSYFAGVWQHKEFCPSQHYFFLFVFITYFLFSNSAVRGIVFPLDATSTCLSNLFQGQSSTEKSLLKMLAIY